ncbi:VOC family protein [Paenibacillus sp. P26]|nr:VOC family protein [Paenibacillus sp. P26]
MAYRIHPDTAIGQVKPRVSDLERSVGFYREVVGLKVLRSANGTAELTADGVRALLLITELPDAVVPPRRSAAGLYHFAILLPDRESLGMALRNLIRGGIHIGHSDHLVSEALYITDPDNNGIEIYADRPRSRWKRDENNEYIMTLEPIDWDGLLGAGGEEPWAGLPRDTTIGHIHLHVSDLEKTRSFYNGVLGFDITAHMDDSALFFSAGGYHHHIGLNTWAGVGTPLAPPNATGLDYFTITIPDRTELETLAQRLTEAAIPIRKDGESIIVHDPSGIEIRLERKEEK